MEKGADGEGRKKKGRDEAGDGGFYTSEGALEGDGHVKVMLLLFTRWR